MKNTKLKPNKGKPNQLNGNTSTEGKDEKILVEIALKKIKEMLYYHQIIPGQKIIYQDLTRKLNMSITPILQALNRLQYMNVVYYTQNKGYYVCEADPIEAGDLFSAREAIETYLVPTIIKKMTDKKLNGIEKAMNEHIEATSIPEYTRMLMIKDSKFHLKIIESAESQVFYNLCDMIFEQTYLKYRPEYMIAERSKMAAEEHRMILESLKEKDIKKTKKLIEQHIERGSKHIVSILWQDQNIEI